MPEDVRRRIFDPFFTTRSPHRTGLGLSVVHGVVNRHHGSVRVRSEHGGGTTVTLWFPASRARGEDLRPAASVVASLPNVSDVPVAPDVASAPDVHEAPEVSNVHDVPTLVDAQVEEQRRSEQAQPALDSPAVDAEDAAVGESFLKPAAGPEVVSILVLEDEEQIRTMLVEALTTVGHRVESASDGLQGLARFQGGQFDVVLTDLSLPECSGLDVARSVKRLRPETPVVLITGWGHLLDPERLRESGVDLMLVKPFRLERVLSVLGDALRLRPSA